MAEQGVGVGLDLVAAEVLDGGDDELDRRLGLEVGKLAFQIGLRRRRQNMRVVDDAAGQRRERRRRPRRAERQQRDERERDPAQNFTFGAACASGAAENSTIGLLRE
jgi:hypothetical protein